MTTETIECPRCGRVAVLEPDTQPFCRRCDSPLMWQPPRAVTAPTPDDGQALAPSDAGRMEQGCAKCGYHSRIGHDFCEACGASLRPGPVRQRQQWVEPVTEEGKGARKRRIVVQIAVVVTAILLVAVLVFAVWRVSRPPAWETSTLDTGNASWDISATLWEDGSVISYVDAGNQAVRVLVCASTTCETRESTEIANSLGGSGQGHGTSIAITEAGLPIVSFRDGEAGALAVVACADLACPEATPVPVDPPADAVPDDLRAPGHDSSILIGADGLPLISHWDRGAHRLMVTHCANVACTVGTTSTVAGPDTVDPDAPVGGDTAIAVGPSTPMIAFRNENPTRLDLLSCADAACTSGKVVTLMPRVDQENSTSMKPGYENSMVLDAQGFPIVAYADRADDNIYVVHCLDATCTNIDRYEVDGDPLNFNSEPSIVLVHGNPVVAFRATPHGDESGLRQLKLVRCSNVSCSRRSDPEIVGGAAPGRLQRAWAILSRQPSQLVGRVGYSPSVRVTSNGRIVIVYGDATEGSLKLAISR